jgi:hypothetical protein
MSTVQQAFSRNISAVVFAAILTKAPALPVQVSPVLILRRCFDSIPATK